MESNKLLVIVYTKTISYKFNLYAVNLRVFAQSKKQLLDCMLKPAISRACTNGTVSVVLSYHFCLRICFPDYAHFATVVVVQRRELLVGW